METICRVITLIGLLAQSALWISCETVTSPNEAAFVIPCDSIVFPSFLVAGDTVALQAAGFPTDGSRFGVYLNDRRLKVIRVDPGVVIVAIPTDAVSGQLVFRPTTGASACASTNMIPVYREKKPVITALAPWQLFSGDTLNFFGNRILQKTYPLVLKIDGVEQEPIAVSDSVFRVIVKDTVPGIKQAQFYSDNLALGAPMTFKIRPRSAEIISLQYGSGHTNEGDTITVELRLDSASRYSYALQVAKVDQEILRQYIQGDSVCRLVVLARNCGELFVTYTLNTQTNYALNSSKLAVHMDTLLAPKSVKYWSRGELIVRFVDLSQERFSLTNPADIPYADYRLYKAKGVYNVIGFIPKADQSSGVFRLTTSTIRGVYASNRTDFVRSASEIFSASLSIDGPELVRKIDSTYQVYMSSNIFKTSYFDTLRLKAIAAPDYWTNRSITDSSVTFSNRVWYESVEPSNEQSHMSLVTLKVVFDRTRKVAAVTYEDTTYTRYVNKRANGLHSYNNTYSSSLVLKAVDVPYEESATAITVYAEDPTLNIQDIFGSSSLIETSSDPSKKQWSMYSFTKVVSQRKPAFKSTLAVVLNR